MSFFQTLFASLGGRQPGRGFAPPGPDLAPGAPPAPAPAPVEEAEMDGPPIEVNTPNHRGMFGLRGTPRDILGILGDAFLTQAGKDSVYSQQRKGEKYQDAMSNFGTDPLGSLAQAYGVDPKLAGVDMNNYQDNETAKAKNALDTKRFADEYALKKATADLEVRDRSGRLFNPSVVNAKNWGKTKELYLKTLAKNGLEPEFEIPDQYDPDIAEQIFSSGISQKDAVSLENTKAYRDATVNLNRQKLDEVKIDNAADRKDRSIRTAADTAKTSVETIRAADEIANPQKYKTPKTKGGSGVPAGVALPGLPPAGGANKGRTIKAKGKLLKSNGTRWIAQ